MTPAQRLTITNGDSAASTLSEAGVGGKVVPWRDVLHEGPVDSSLPLEHLSKMRARFIADQRWDDLAEVNRSFAERDRVISHSDHFDEIVLWFEGDLYDQLQLLQLLDFFGSDPARGETVSIVVVDGYIPPLPLARLKELDSSRRRVTPDQFRLAERAWKAFGSNDPTAISRLLTKDTSSLPYVGRALARHLEEFPSSDNGLSRSEREALTAIEAGHSTPVAAFLAVGAKEESIFLGDTIFYSYLERLSGKHSALVTWEDGTAVIAPAPDRIREFVDGELRVTPLGRDVLAGKRDWQRMNEKTRWLGGVKIEPGEAGWRWDRSKRKLVRKKNRASPPTKGPKTRSPSRRAARKKK